MSSENHMTSDTLQLQQTIIYLKAEVAKLKKQIEKHEESDHYSLISILERDNSQLIMDKTELTKELTILNEEYERLMYDSQERLHSQEVQMNEQLTSIEMLQKANEDQWIVNKQLVEYLQKPNSQITAIQSMLVDHKETIKKVESNLFELIQRTASQVHLKIDEVGIIKQDTKESMQLVQELEEKNNSIRNLQTELLALQKHHSSSSLHTVLLKAETLEQLDDHITRVLTDSAEYERRLAENLVLLDTLEQQLNQF